jgi:hypothetical protein
VTRKATKSIMFFAGKWIPTSALTFILFVVLSLLKTTCLEAQTIPINQWNSHFNYLSGQQLVQTENRVFCASFNGLWSVTLAGTDLLTYDKQAGLTETGVSSIAYDALSKTLLLAYRSGNLDLIYLDQNSNLESVSSWPVFQSAADLPDKKNISKIVFHDNHAYLATNFGIVVLDINLHQVHETYRYIGSNGTEVVIKDMAFTTDSIYVLTSQGLQVSSLHPSVNRQYYANWKMLTTPGEVVAIVSQNDLIYAGLSGKGIYQISNGSWKPVLVNLSKYYSFSNSDAGISVTLDTSHLFLSKSDNGSVLSSPLITEPKKSSATSPESVWIADPKNGLLSNIDGSVKMYNPIQQDTTIHPRTDSSITDLTGHSWTRLPSYLAGGILVRNVASNKERHLNTSLGNGGLPSSMINSITIDQDGAIWFASDKGVGYIFPDDALISSSINAILPIYGQRRLFANEKCTAIAAESGNRKWVGTRNGLYLFSSDATELITHFNTTNSPLPSNIINALNYEPATGILFIDTPNGMVSYRTGSMQASENLTNITIFPNPVRPGYSGLIGIKGLTDHSNVKITQLSGRLVYETTSEGGLASWNLNDYTGRRVKGGVYIVYVVSSNGDQRIAGKLAVID